MRLLVYDTAYPDQTSTATVPVQVTRNDAAPIFSRSEYETELAENQRLGSSVLQLLATDDDDVRPSVSCLTPTTPNNCSSAHGSSCD